MLGEKNTALIVTSRSEVRAQELAKELRNQRPGTVVSGVRLDLSSPDFSDDLKSLRPDIVVHTVSTRRRRGTQPDRRIHEEALNKINARVA